MEVVESLNKLDVSKSTGLDGLGPRILKLITPIISKSICHIINLSIMTGTFPTILKQARVIPIHKSGNTEDPGNYRPISILPTLSKIIEKHVVKQCLEYLERFSLLHKEQSGFRKSHSCHTALIKLTDTLYKQIDEGNLTGLVYIDFKKAFDLVNHQLLLQKLKLYNFDKYSIKWFNSYLSNRVQKVQIGPNYSKSCNISAGVPQGSILGPLLFLIFINDLPLNLTNTNSDIFADDLTLSVSAPNKQDIQTNCQVALNQTNLWSLQNKMVVNKQKTKCMLLGSSQKLSKLEDKNLTLILNDTTLNQVCEHKVLGVTIDNKLSWDAQVNIVCKSLTNKISLLNKIKCYLPLECRKLYYNAYILPIMDYCDTIWGNCTKYNVNKIVKLQKRAARVILNTSFDSPSDPLFKKLKWLTFPQRIMYHKAIQVYKSLNNLSPSYMFSLFNNNKTDHNLRSVSNGDLLPPKFRLNCYKNSLSYSGSTIWNSIPFNIRKSSTLQEFKSKLYNLYISNNNT